MDFFKSVFSADPTSPPQQQQPPPEPPNPSPDADEQGGIAGGRWRGLIKTFATKSESMIQTYRRDLEEFGSGLKKETAAIREAAARAALDLPGSLEAGASVAQESLESVGQAIDDFGGSVWRGTSEIISQSKEAILSMEAEASGTDQYPSDRGLESSIPSSKRYSRFEAQVLAIQSDVNTFSEEPEDAQDFNNWRSGFDLAEKEEEIERLCYENGAVETFLEKLVPQSVDYETFWCRYYYRVHKLKQVEDTRAELVKRVISGEEEEDLSWEVDDDNDDDAGEELKDGKKEETLRKIKVVEVEKEEKEEDINKEVKETETEKEEIKETEAEMEEEKKNEIKKVVQKEDMNPEPVEPNKYADFSQVENLEGSTEKNDKGVTSNAGKAENPELTREGMNPKSDDKTYDNTVQEGKMKAIASCKDSRNSVVKCQLSVEEEVDFGWDENEDLGEHNDKKSCDTSASPLRVDLHKRLNVVEDDEDLNWDIEDDDESTKP